MSMNKFDLSFQNNKHLQTSGGRIMISKLKTNEMYIHYILNIKISRMTLNISVITIK